MRRHLPEPDRQTGGGRAADRRADHCGYRSALYFGTFFSNLSKQIKKLGLPRPFYRLELDAAGLSVWMAGEQNKTEPTNRYTWNTVYCAYRTKEAVYIYVQKNQAYLLNESMDAAWSLLGSALPAASLHDCRK